MNDYSDEWKKIFELDDLYDDVDKIINRYEDDRNSLFIKLLEEIGEYAEAIEYEKGVKRKVDKFDVSPEEKLREEIADVLLIVLALGKQEGLNLKDLLERIKGKFEIKGM